MESTRLEQEITDLYSDFLKKMDINEKDGVAILKGETLRFSGFPYIGADYHNAKKKILFVGLDIGIDELKEENTYHSIESRRACIAGSTERCNSFPQYNPHISGTYSVALYALKDIYNWSDSWQKLYTHKEFTTKKAIDILSKELPINVMDYVVVTNIHKFVTKCRGCVGSEQKCWSHECNGVVVPGNRTGDNNRKWYSKDIELELFMNEIELFNPDIIVFQGSGKRLPEEMMDKLKGKYGVIDSHHPSAWNVRANKLEYSRKIIDESKSI